MFTAFIKNTLIPLLLRLGLATIFIYHGIGKVSGPDNEWGTRWAKVSDKAPEVPPAPLQFAVAWGELIGGIALAIGFLSRGAAVGIILIMAGAIATVHWKNGFGAQNGGFEYNFAIIVMAICVVLGGPGPIAVDRFFHLKRKKQPPA